ncbi:PurH2 [Prochlorococcus phage P-SSM2]|jgi:phosphoribosylaminoimidazolecarboxamide formyltransferase/IMP cyclohydrolase|uniref:Phosphoribosylaminoimidazolecarboxamide formyltransferase/IMP cyclohydrolase n=2 Tax=Salacisavirus pssm2 TaxID=2734140 RepID=Q58MG3_BPPRM|nr:PurH2 [Prochlorococcus phage P-SSM2]AAX44569.1 PurH2 [Prochlorococcus phage P-SSM2]ACY76072.1 phosphoribosylaminoimidazolecarboxamide formyltransferase/IMP cyclohydrolase [Prochlorococcus phage P-SSM2]AGN12404.1 PurH2 [Prochlorococcus phage P-SSM5]
MANYALLSVSNKTGIVDFARSLVDYGYTIISSGGTHSVIAAEGIPVTKVSDYTGSPEILNGRVKTLHPKIHGGILAQRGNPVHDMDRNANDIGLIDIVAVNLYPFAETVAKPDVTLADAIENIDIGGPSMVRSAAKNYKDVAVMTNPHQYGIYMDSIKGNLSIKPETLREQFMVEAFRHTAEYDTTINRWMEDQVL